MNRRSILIQEGKMKRKKRNPILAAFLSFITPGLGQCYNTQLIKGIIFFAISIVVPILFSLTGLHFHLPGLIALLTLGICYWLFIMGDAFFVALRKREVVLKLYNKWYIYLLIFVFFIILNVTTSSFFMNQVWRMRAYQIAAGSMEPTLLIGDHVLVDLKYFETNEVERGDLVMVEYPKDSSKLFVKRAIALEGEKIEIRNKQVYINDEPIQEDYKIHRDSQILTREEHHSEAIRDNYGPWVVPPGQLFVLGDNRDNSMDSRYWGVSSSSSVKGKPWIIYFSYEAEKGAYLKRGLKHQLKRLISLIPKARWKRIFKEIK
jgi:signal peptidase I